MVLIWGCPRERVSKSLYVMQLFILAALAAGMVYFFFHGRRENTSEDHLVILEFSKCIGETLRPVWGPADKCYPVTQNLRTENRKWQARLPSQRAPKVTSPPAAALEDPQGLADVVGKKELGTASQENKQEQKATLYTSEPPVHRRPGWVMWLLRGLWLDWFSAPNLPKTQNH